MATSTGNPTATTLPPAVRVFKIVGTVSASVLAGLYLSSSLHTVPALLSLQNDPAGPPSSTLTSHTHQPAAVVVKTFYRIYKTSHNFYRNLIILSAGSFSYVGWWLYNYLPSGDSKEKLVEAQASFSSSSFLPRTSTKAHEHAYDGGEFFGIGGVWLYFVTGGILVLGIIPYTKLVMRSVNHRLLSAGEALEVEEKKRIGLSVVDERGTWRDLDSWRRWNWGRVGLAGTAGLLGGVGITYVH